METMDRISICGDEIEEIVQAKQTKWVLFRVCGEK